MRSYPIFPLNDDGRYRLVIAPSPEALADWGATQIIHLAQEAVARRGVFHWALSGGNTPRLLYCRLAKPGLSGRIPWSQVHIWWGDERNVLPTHEQSNYRMAYEALLAHVPLPEGNVHRFLTEQGDPNAAADAYEAELRRLIPAWPDALPALDLILLGMGEDGHTASLFPHTSALQERTRLVVSNPVPALQTTRLTLTLPVLNAAAHVLVLVSGATKAETLQRVLFGPHRPEDLPVQAVRPLTGTLTWLVDAEAASRLDGLERLQP